jgi:hypothetical protein
MAIFHKPAIGMTSPSHVRADLPAREDSFECFVPRGPLAVLWASGCVVGTRDSPQSQSGIGNTSRATSAIIDAMIDAIIIDAIIIDAVRANP